MTGDDDIDGLAGEYVIGTLEAAERASVAARRMREPALDAAIRAWEIRLSPIADLVPQAAPSPTVLKNIHQRIGVTSAGPAPPSNIVSMADVSRLQRSRSFWRATALTASALAASVVGMVGYRELTPEPPQKNLVAILQKDAASPAFLVQVDIDNRLMTVRPVDTKQEPGKSFELWIIHDSLGSPKSLGVVDTPTSLPKPILASYKPDVIEGATYAITLEPEGGSRDGKPSGAPIFVGKLIPASK